MGRDRYSLEWLRQSISMSQKIVTQDPTYGKYAGADFQTAKKMAQIDFMLKIGLIPDKFKLFVKAYREYLDYYRKAYFSTIGCSELSKLGFLLGNTRTRKDATDTTGPEDEF